VTPTAAEGDAARTLSVGIVVFRPDLALLRRVLDRLAAATRAAAPLAVTVDVVDNGPPGDEGALDALLEAVRASRPPFPIEVIRGQGNVGYGRASNLSIARSAARFHLVLNPDAELEPDALARGLARLEADPSIGMLAAWTVGADGVPQRLCKQYPSVLVLAMRALGLPFFRARVAAYDVQPGPGELTDVTGRMVSGSFMLCRTATLKAIGGFDPAYFLYFEDFDLSLRMARVARLVWARDVRIAHHGGAASRKGWLHRRLFARSALRFFSTHGWRLW